MQLNCFFAIGFLGLSGPLAVADDADCAALTNAQERQDRLQHKYDRTADCSKLTDPQALKECAEHKANNNGNSVDCSKLASPEARRECAKQKAK